MVTRAEFNAGMARVDKKIELSTEAIKKVTAQANKATADLGASTSRLDKQTGELKKEVKRQGDTSLLLTLLNKPPALKLTTQKVPGPGSTETAPVEVEVLSKVEYEKQSNLLPLLLLTQGGGGGFGGGDSSNMLILALALSGQI